MDEIDSQAHLLVSVNLFQVSTNCILPMIMRQKSVVGTKSLSVVAAWWRSVVDGPCPFRGCDAANTRFDRGVNQIFLGSDGSIEIYCSKKG
jgi:hypothetical protein